MKDHDLFVAAIATTGLILLLLSFIFFLLFQLRRQFRRGIKWANDNAPRGWTNESMKDFAFFVVNRGKKDLTIEEAFKEFVVTNKQVQLITKEVEGL